MRTSSFADGSVHFLKDSIQSWQFNPATGYPLGVTDNNGIFTLAAGTQLGVYQKLSTRARGEVDQLGSVLRSALLEKRKRFSDLTARGPIPHLRGLATRPFLWRPGRGSEVETVFGKRELSENERFWPGAKHGSFEREFTFPLNY